MKRRENRSNVFVNGGRVWIRIGFTTLLIAYAALWHYTHGGGSPATGADVPAAAAVQSAESGER